MKVSFIRSSFSLPFDRHRIEVRDDKDEMSLLTAGCDAGAIRTAYFHLQRHYGSSSEEAVVALTCAAYAAGTDDEAKTPEPVERECAHEWVEVEGEPPYDICTSCGETRR